MTSGTEQTILDFSKTQNGQPWSVIDDRIMGGASQGAAGITGDGTLRFSGTVSLENQGGFASVRSAEGNYGLGQGKQVMIRVKGDGKTYKLGMRIDQFFDGVTYLSEFRTETDQWQEICLPLEEFRPFHHGQKLANAAAFDPALVKSFVLLIGSRQEGPFALDVAWIKIV